MEYMKLAIVTDDRRYAEALGRSLLRGNRNFDMQMYSSDGFCGRWREEGYVFRESFDLVLWDSEGMEPAAGGNIVWLTERRSTAAAGEEVRTIYKYSPSQEMTAEIFSAYEELTGRSALGRRPDDVMVIVFSSWQGGCGCTTLALAAAQEMVRSYRKRVLYLSLEGMESTPQYMNRQGGLKTAGEFLCHLLMPAQKQGLPFLEQYMISDDYGVEAFSPSAGCNPLYELGEEEFQRFLCALMESSRYDVILIDAGSSAGGSARAAMGSCDRICLVSSRREDEREDRYRAYLAGCFGENTANRVIRIVNRCAGEEAEAIVRRLQAVYDDSALLSIAEHEAGTEIILEGSFGKDVHSMTELWYNYSDTS